ncbi:hypothetical protein [Actinopolyspora mortivallis]|uniref:hypothetical protein n=1 Tax=Actinopolyspora mortivallis TaxID=33906 RepID=UPI0015E62372|nr:hypothetical protein [Actinopolyspora mortivallis]
MKRVPPTGVSAAIPVGLFLVWLVIGAPRWVLWTLGTLAGVSVAVETTRLVVLRKS